MNTLYHRGGRITVCGLLLALSFCSSRVSGETLGLPGTTIFDSDVSRMLSPVSRAPLALALAPTAEDLAASPGVDLGAEIQTQAQILGNNPLTIYRWVRDEVRFIPSAGLLRNARLTLADRAGNASDIASLLIALLRASDVPARYVRGTIRVPVDALRGWLGVTNDEAALALLTQGGLAHEPEYGGGQLSAVVLEHIWVEAWVALGPERGSSRRSGDHWLALDASAKTLQYQSGTLINGDVGDAVSALLEELPAQTVVDVDGAWRGSLDTGTLEETMEVAMGLGELNNPLVVQLGNSHIMPESRPVLPVGLPFVPQARYWSGASLPETLRQQIVLSLRGPASTPLEVTQDLYTLLEHPLWLRFISDDAQVVSEISHLALAAEPLPGHRLPVTAELWQGDQRLGSLGAFPLGETLQLRVRQVLGDWVPLDHSLTLHAGEHRLLAWSADGGISHPLQALADRLRDTPVSLETLLKGLAQTLGTALSIHQHWQVGATGGQAFGAVKLIALGPRLKVEQQHGLVFATQPAGLALELLRQPLIVAGAEADQQRLVWQLGQIAPMLAADTLALLPNGGSVIDPQVALEAGLAHSPERVFWVATPHRDELQTALTDAPELFKRMDRAVAAGWQGSLSAPLMDTGTALYGAMLHDPHTGSSAAWLEGPEMAPATALAVAANPVWLLAELAPGPLVQRVLDLNAAPVAEALEDLLPLMEAPWDRNPQEPLKRLLSATLVDLAAGPQLPPLLADGLWQGLVRDNLSIAALRDPLPPILELSFSATELAVGEVLSISASASDDRGEVSLTVLLDDIPLVGEGSYAWTPDRAGEYRLRVEAQDAAGNRVWEEQLIRVTAPDDSEAPQLALDEFIDPMTAPQAINATVTDANLLDWQLRLQPRDGGEPQLLAQGSDPMDGSLATLDTTLLRNGLYRLVLSARDANGLESQLSRDVVVDGRLKLGDFGFAVVDLTVPMVGLPIQVARAYDTRQRQQALAFGQGWSAVHQAVTVAESRTPGIGWQLAEYQTGPMGAVTRFCVEPLDRPQVVITLPDERLARFAIEASPACQDLVPALDVSLSFRPLGDTQATLSEADAIPLRYQDGTLVDPGSGAPGNPDRYRLSTRNGYEYLLDQHFGIREIVGPNGNRIRFDADGVHHDDGRSIRYQRDASGRIASVLDPLDRAHHYQHDAVGDLVAYTDPLGQTTRYEYDDDHRLVAIIDPDGTRRLQNHFDASGRLTARTGPLGDTTAFTHDIPGRSSRILDALGRETQLYYDDEGKLLRRIDPLGGEQLHSYDGNGYLASVTDPAGHITRFEHNAAGDILAVTDALGDTTRYEYDPAGRLLALVDTRGHRFEITRDGRGNPVSFTDAFGHTATQTVDSRGLVSHREDYLGNRYHYEYNAMGELLAETDPLGNRTEYTLDEMGNLLASTRYRQVEGVLQAETTHYELDALDRVVSVVDPLGRRQRYEYDTLGEDQAYVSPLGQRTSFETDGYGQVTRTIFPDGQQQSREYDAVGNLLSITDRAGRVTRYTYNALNRLLSETAPDGAVTRHEYNLAGDRVATIDPLGNRYVSEYDAAGQLLRQVDPSGVSLALSYDAAGNPLTLTDASGAVTRHEYDAADRRVRTVYPDGVEIRLVYDANGRLIRRQEAGGQQTRYGYDALNRLTSVTDALGNITRHEYDELGNRVAQIDANGHTTRWTYDPRGRPISRTLPNGAQERFIYDEGGLLLRHHTFGGDTISYQRNLMDWVVAIHDGTESIAMDYNARGLRTRVRDYRGETRYAYDARDRVAAIIQPNGSQVAYEYDLAGRRSRLGFTPVDGLTRWQDYGYDSASRLASVTDWQGRVTEFAYDSRGNREEIRYPNGLLNRVEYDPRQRPRRIETLQSDGTLLFAQDYTHTLDGQRASVTELDGWFSEYHYDELHRLVEASSTAPDGTPYVERYVYDPVGNRVEAEQDGVLTAYQYNANDQLTRAGGEDYHYDPAGNLIRQQQGSERTEYRYDPWNRLRTMEQYLGGSLVKQTEYDYNPQGLRTAARVDGVQRSFILDSARPHAQLLAELDASGGVDAAYVGVDGIIARHTDSESRYLHADALGSTRLLTDAAGMEVTRYRYDAYGNPLSGAVAENPFLFAGEQYDGDLGMYYLRARYYQPGSGRLTAMDPLDGVLHRSMSQHKYLYALNDPVNAVDPSGLFSLAEMNISNDIRAELSDELIDASMGVLDAVFSNNPDAIGSAQTGAMALVAMAGQNAMQLRNLFSRRARTSCGIKRNSFPEGTLVHTESGTQAIDDLAIGQRVLAFDEASGEQRYQEILHLITNQTDYELVVLTLADGSTLEATDAHPFLVEGQGWVAAEALQAGDVLHTAQGETLAIRDTQRVTRNTRVYNLSVAEHPTYYVGESGVLVHNARCRQRAPKRNFNVVVIGRNMEGRVKPFARFFGTFWYQPRPPVPPPPPSPVLPTMDQNRRWIRSQMKQNRTIYDIGPGGNVGYSAFYEMEINEVMHYRGRSRRKVDGNGQVTFSNYRGGRIYPRYRPVHFLGLFCDNPWTTQSRDGGTFSSGSDFCK